MPDAAIRYRFGPFVLDPAARQLARETTPIPLPPKAFDILVLLVRRRERVISKQELLDAIWPDTAVIENTLTQRIREIRDALGDDAQEPQWLKTASRIGYRFIGAVVEETPPEPIAAVPAEIAVIPSVPVVATQGVDEPAGIANGHITGRRFPASVVCSNACARRRTDSSPHGGPTICRPIGRPFFANPQGMDMEGSP